MIDLQIEEEKNLRYGASIKVIGVGGAGGNAVNSMINSSDITAVEFMVANTDAQALDLSPVKYKIQLGRKVTKGLGAGANPDMGRRAAEEDLEVICKYLEDTDILFLTGGLGGGTGSGALPVIARAARELGILTVGIVTKPFMFEGRRRMHHAQEAIKVLRGAVDTLIIVPNQKLLDVVDPNISMLDAFALSNSILKQAIKGISDIITKPGHINVDFADVRTVMKDMGMAIMGTGRAEGDQRARQAALKAISSQLLEDVNIHGARGVLINITGNTDLRLHEINEAASVVYDIVSEDANIILGSVIDTSMDNEIMVTVIATGFEQEAGRENMLGALNAKTRSAYQSSLEQRGTSDRQAHFTPQPAPVEREKKSETLSLHVSAPQTKVVTTAEEALDLDDLDTPTFLRKKSITKEHQGNELS